MAHGKRLYAWAWAPDEADRVNEWRDRFPGLGLVHYAATYRHARPGDIAHVNTVSQAREVARRPDVWAFAILGDEPNVKGRETPAQYQARLAYAEDLLRTAGIVTCSAGLAMAGGRFDDEYLESITFANLRGVNSRPASAHRLRAGIARHPDLTFFATLIPVRANWWPLKYNSVLAYLWQQLFVRPLLTGQIALLRDRPNVAAVGLWCLREGRLGDGHWQGFHGLIDRHDRLTWQGRLVRLLLAREG